MKEAELRRCQIHEWYPNFQRHSIRTLFHPLPDSFVRYLLGLSAAVEPEVEGDDPVDDDADDSATPPPLFLLPRPVSGRDPLPRTTARVDPISLLDSSGFSSDSDDNEADGDSATAPSFPELESAVERSIAELGGAAFPKLNWSAPKDAAWITTDGTLRCSSFADVALLLHASDSIVYDLSDAVPSCSDHNPKGQTVGHEFYLALRKWYPSLRPEMEFRCFVRRRCLVAVSQREVTNFYPALIDRRDEIPQLVGDFFTEAIQPRFESEDYTFDVYVTGGRKVKLIDFNPWGGFTLSLLFSWEELERKEENEHEDEGDEEERLTASVEFRIVDSQCGVRPGLKTAVPYDYLDTAEGSGWDQFLRNADAELRRQAQAETEAHA